MQLSNSVYKKSSFFSINARSLKQEKTDDGILMQYNVPIARDGEFIYRAYEFSFIDEDGIDPNKELRLYRPATSFSKEILEKNKDISFTNDHPNSPITTENAKEERVGTVGPLYFKDGILYAEWISVYDEDTIEDIEKNGKKEVSIGFEAYYKIAPVMVDGKEYDGLEEILRINHLSLVEEGKAGKQFKMHKSEEKPMNMVKMTINGVEMDVPENVANAMKQEQTNSQIQSIATSVNALTTAVTEVVKMVNEMKGDMDKANEDEDKKKDDSENRVGCDEPIKEDKLNKKKRGKNEESETAEEDKENADEDYDESKNADEGKEDEENGEDEDDDEELDAKNKKNKKHSKNSKTSVEDNMDILFGSEVFTMNSKNKPEESADVVLANAVNSFKDYSYAEN